MNSVIEVNKVGKIMDRCPGLLIQQVRPRDLNRQIVIDLIILGLAKDETKGRIVMNNQLKAMDIMIVNGLWLWLWLSENKQRVKLIVGNLV